MAGWVTIQPTKVYTLQAHRAEHILGLSWDICKDCGLVRLKNDFSEWCWSHGCNYRLHSGYKHQYARSGIHPLRKNA